MQQFFTFGRQQRLEYKLLAASFPPERGAGGDFCPVCPQGGATGAIQALWPHLPDPGRLAEGDDIVRQGFAYGGVRSDYCPFPYFDA